MKTFNQLFHFGASLVFALTLAACKGGGGGGGGNNGAQANACGAVPTVNLGGLTGSDLQSAIQSFGSSIMTSDNRFIVPFQHGGGNYKGLIWDGTQWTVKGITPGYSSSSGYLNLFDFGGKLVGEYTAGPGTARTHLYFENSPDFDILDTSLLFTPIVVNGNSALQRMIAVGYGASSGIVFAQNTVPGSYANWTTQTLDSDSATYYPIQTGFFADNTPYVIATKTISGTTTMKVYRRVGTVWSSAFNLGTGSVSMDSPAAFADVAHNRVYVYWTVYFNSPSRTEVHAAIIDLAAQAYVSDVKIATVNNPNYTNEVTVKAAFFSNGNGILAVHAAGKGQVFLGTTTPASFGQVEPYRPDVAWNSLSFNVGVMSCDQAILAGADGVFTPYIYALTPNQYDGVQGN